MTTQSPTQSPVQVLNLNYTYKCEKFEEEVLVVGFFKTPDANFVSFLVTNGIAKGRTGSLEIEKFKQVYPICLNAGFNPYNDTKKALSNICDWLGKKIEETQRDAVNSRVVSEFDHCVSKVTGLSIARNYIIEYYLKENK